MTTDEMEESVQQLNLRIAEIKDAIDDIYSDYEASNLRPHQSNEQGGAYFPVARPNNRGGNNP